MFTKFFKTIVEKLTNFSYGFFYGFNKSNIFLPQAFKKTQIQKCFTLAYKGLSKKFFFDTYRQTRELGYHFLGWTWSVLRPVLQMNLCVVPIALGAIRARLETTGAVYQLGLLATTVAWAVPITSTIYVICSIPDLQILNIILEGVHSQSTYLSYMARYLRIIVYSRFMRHNGLLWPSDFYCKSLDELQTEVESLSADYYQAQPSPDYPKQLDHIADIVDPDIRSIISNLDSVNPCIDFLKSENNFKVPLDECWNNTDQSAPYKKILFRGLLFSVSLTMALAMLGLKHYIFS
jgi:hypothetical protein